MHTTSPPAPISRDVITDDALLVAPELLGLPLARPWRRAVAAAVDGLFVLILANAPGVLFGLAAALVLFRVSARSAAGSGYLGRSLRLGFRFTAALVLFGVVSSGWGSLSERLETGFSASAAGDSPASGSSIAAAGPAVPFRGREGLALMGDAVTFRAADTPEEARRRGDRIARAMAGAGMEHADIAEVLHAVAQSAPDKPWLGAAADSVLAGVARPGAAPPHADTLLLAYAEARRAGETARAEALRPQLVTALARDTLAELSEEVHTLRRERVRLATRVDALEDADRSPGVVARLKTMADDLGFGFTWGALYFTAALALWQGRTPGKRLMGIRVIRLNGKPIGWWIAFERFGGYAAGVATGLLGFAQVYWDRNRQAIHDKISETAVIRG